MSNNKIIAIGVLGVIASTGLVTTAEASESHSLTTASPITFDEKGNALFYGETFDKAGGTSIQSYYDYQTADITVNIFQCNCNVNKGCDPDQDKKTG